MNRWGILLVMAGMAAACKALPSATVLTETGRDIFQTHCAPCHGPTGKGDGPLAKGLWPKPRDLSTIIFKYRTVRGSVPSDNDIMQVLKTGIPGTAMPGWDMLSLEDWRSVVQYLKTLTPRLTAQSPGPRFEVPEETAATPDAIALGKQLYDRSGCIACHGGSGKGDGPAAHALQDVWGEEILPRDLTRGPLKWGNTSKDIYRTLAMGIPGTPMPAFEQTFNARELWALVHYLKSVQNKVPKDYDPSSPKRHLIPVGRVNGVFPTADDALAWKEAAPVSVFLKPMKSNPESPEWLTVRALHDGRTIVFDLHWEKTPQPVSSVAVQFPEKRPGSVARLPFLLATSGMRVEELRVSPGQDHVLVKLPMTHSSDKEGYVSFRVSGALFSEWMPFELK